MESFDFNPRTRFVFGVGAVDRLGELARECTGRRVLLVSDAGIAAAGHVEHAENSLKAAGLEVATFTGVEENPTTRHVEAAVEFARAEGVNLIVGLGGGSSMDCAKGCNFILTNGGRMQDYWGVDKATKPMLPMIAIPTTSGTGSEAQSFALISDEETHMKMACGDTKAACRVAILDPALTVSMPAEVAAVTGIDAISHAVETFVTRRRNPVSQMLSRRAFELLSENFSRVFERPKDLEARGAMLLGASLAGLAIENSMLGAAHSCANPVTARYGMAHGRAIGILLPHVIRANGEGSEEIAGLYAELAGAGGGSNGSGHLDAVHPDAARRLAAKVEGFASAAGLPARLSECGVEREALAEMAGQAAEQWTAQFNPRALTEAEFAEIYECAF